VFDVAVIGLGAMGSATIYQLSKRGIRAVGIDAFRRGHELGSSIGLSRVIRVAYFEQPDYVPLLRRAWDLWRELEAESGVELLRETGGLYIGASDSRLITGSLASAREHNLPHQLLSKGELQELHPALTLDADQCAVFEEQAGILTPEGCIAAHLALAERGGGEPQVR
jgi:sarcosine oxidase